MNSIRKKRKLRGWTSVESHSGTQNNIAVNELATPLTDQQVTDMLAGYACGIGGFARDAVFLIATAAMNPNAQLLPIMEEESQVDMQPHIAEEQKHSLDHQSTHRVVIPELSRMAHELEIMVPGGANCPLKRVDGSPLILPKCKNDEMCICMRHPIENESGDLVPVVGMSYVTEQELAALRQNSDVLIPDRCCVFCIRHDFELIRAVDMVRKKSPSPRQLPYYNSCDPVDGGFPSYMFVCPKFGECEAQIICHRPLQLYWKTTRGGQPIRAEFRRLDFQFEWLAPFPSTHHVISAAGAEVKCSQVDAVQSLEQQDVWGIAFNEVIVKRAVNAVIPLDYSIDGWGGMLVDPAQCMFFKKEQPHHILFKILAWIFSDSASTRSVLAFDRQTRRYMRNMVRRISMGLRREDQTVRSAKRILSCKHNMTLSMCSGCRGGCNRAIPKQYLQNWCLIACARYFIWYWNFVAPSQRTFIGMFFDVDKFEGMLSKWNFPADFEGKPFLVNSVAHHVRNTMKQRLKWEKRPYGMLDDVASTPCTSPRKWGRSPGNSKKKVRLNLQALVYVWRIGSKCETMSELIDAVCDWGTMKTVGCDSATFRLTVFILKNASLFTKSQHSTLRGLIERTNPYFYSVLQMFVTAFRRSVRMTVGFLNPKAYIHVCISMRNNKRVQRYANDPRISSILVCELCGRIACLVKGSGKRAENKKDKRKPAIQLCSPDHVTPVMLCKECGDAEVKWVDLRGRYIVVNKRRIIFCGVCCCVSTWVPFKNGNGVYPMDEETGLPVCFDCIDLYWDTK